MSLLFSAIVCEGGVLKVFKVTGILLFFIKILVPIVLLVMGIIDLFQAIFGTDPKALNTSIHAFLQRIIAGVIIFFVPTLLKVVLTFVVGGYDFVNQNGDEGFSRCNTCLFEPSNCTIDAKGDWMQNIEEKID